MPGALPLRRQLSESCVNIDSVYQEIMNQLRAGKRPAIELSKDEVEFLCRYPENGSRSLNDWRPWLAIVTHSRKGHFEFQSILVDLLHTAIDPELLVFTLAAFQKHIIEFYQRKGERFPVQTIEALKAPLQNSHLEVVEWALKIIEQLGPQNRLLANALRKLRPGFWKCFFPRQLALRRKINALLPRL